MADEIDFAEYAVFNTGGISHNIAMVTLPTYQVRRGEAVLIVPSTNLGHVPTNPSISNVTITLPTPSRFNKGQVLIIFNFK